MSINCKSKCICKECKRIKINCAECKYSVERTKECLETSIKQCEYFKKGEK